MTNRPLIYAHRGVHTNAPENSLAAFRAAVALGVDGVELDVHLTQDGVPVVIHDGELHQHTTSYPDVWSTPWRALQTVDIGVACGPEYAGTHMPTLADVLTLLAPSPLAINIELKSQPLWHAGLETAVVALVRQHHLASRVLLSSFSPLILWRLQRLAPDLPRGYLLARSAFPLLSLRLFAKLGRVSAFHPCIDLLADPALASSARAQGLQLVCWTVNRAEQLQHARTIGADIVITDDPTLAMQTYGVV